MIEMPLASNTFHEELHCLQDAMISDGSVVIDEHPYLLL